MDGDPKMKNTNAKTDFTAWWSEPSRVGEGVSPLEIWTASIRAHTARIAELGTW